MTLASQQLEGARAGEPFEPDLIVVGAGTAGLAVAIAAGEAGAKVLLLEKTDRIGGTLWVSTAHVSGGGTRLQRERGIADSAREHFDDVMRIGHRKQNRELAWLACREATGMIDWLQAGGFPFSPNVPVIAYGHEPYRKARTYWGVDGGKSMIAFLTAQLDPLVEQGIVRVVLGAPVERLLVEAGEVQGVVVAGEERRAARTVLTTGGFASNPELVARFTPSRRLVSIAARASTGDGLRLAEAIGAAVTGEDIYLPTIAGVEDPDEPGRWFQRAPDTWDVLPVLVPQYRPPAEIWVNDRGERFVREDEPSIDVREHAVTAQPDMAFWVVFDAATLDEDLPLFRVWPPAEVRRLAATGTIVKTGATVAELAGEMGVPAAAIVGEVEQYNAALSNGQPDRLGKQHRPRPIERSPFYAIRLQAMDLLTWPGLKADVELRVLRLDGSPIAGLYAVGEVLGAATMMGDAFCSGMMVGPSISLGRYLGRRLAELLVDEDEFFSNRVF